MDVIYLHGLKVDCVIGCWEWEKRIRQNIVIDLDMGFDGSGAAASDSLEDTLSYKDVAKRVRSFVAESRFQLLEKLAEEIAAIVLGEFPATWCRVRLNKFGAVTGARDVGIVIERGVKT
ncbi:MAG: dihydroneopterin aldolase [Gammaproteobacteria bacterium]|nr:dihydroneopterin aldolase [Gammaproteobacteria bacterium]MYD77094.1 dihydroneopterin aldolase [Gammaproteobacteria bacterium]MYJ51474.1 dihydroneopterin aldolase [Gammaproteobacteria bacterium]